MNQRVAGCPGCAWRMVARFEGSDTDSTEHWVHHHAGLVSSGSGSYIDSVILRDRDSLAVGPVFNRPSVADGALDERVYYLQNWRADVVALLFDSGKMLEWTKYSAYGVPFALPAGDIDSDGDFDSTDVAGTTGAYDVRKDSELDGDVDFNDIYHAAGIAGAYQTLGRGVLSSPAIDNRRGYAGYESDPTFAGANGGGANARTIYHVRHRVYDADVGRWTRRDLLGYVDGMGLYAYVRSMPITMLDVDGEHASTASQDDTDRRLQCKADVRTKLRSKYIQPYCKLVPRSTPKPCPEVELPGVERPLWAQWDIECPIFDTCQFQGLIAGKFCCDEPGATAESCYARAEEMIKECNNPTRPQLIDPNGDGSPMRPFREYFCWQFQRHPDKTACQTACKGPWDVDTWNL